MSKSHFWIRIPYCESRMKAAKSIPGSVWDESRQMWRLPKRRGAEKDVSAVGLDSCLLDPAITIPPRYGYARGNRKVPHPLARLQAQTAARELPNSAFAKTGVSHATVEEDYYETAQERLYVDGTVKQTVGEACIRPHLIAYEAKLRQLGRAEATIRTYRSAVRLYAEWLPVELDQATPGMFRAYLDYCADVRCLKERTVRGVVQAVGVI